MKSSKSTRTIVYINSAASLFADKDPLKTLLDKQLNNKEWLCFDSGLRFVPHDTTDMVNENYYQGYTVAQYIVMDTIKPNGIYINPLLSGLNIDYKLWSQDLIDDNRFEQNIIYIDIPYEVFEEVNDIMTMSREEYENISNSMMSLVQTLNNDIGHSTVVH